MRFRIAHLTSVHDRSDTRVFFKECTSLAGHGYDVSLVTADGRGQATVNGVRIVDVGKVPGRAKRILSVPRRILLAALSLDAHVYHLHDPELMPIGIRLKMMGKHVIFDAHEDFPKQLLHKPYLHPLIATTLSHAASMFERLACSKFDAIVTATPTIRNKFNFIHSRVIDILNFPISDELEAPRVINRDMHTICYVGGLTSVRGLVELLKAVELLRSNVRLILCGRFLEDGFEAKLRSMPGWSRVDYRGHLNRDGVRNALAESAIGVVTLRSAPNHIDSLPVKMFEYMAAGLPVVASDFPLWKTIIQDSACGVCVNPENPQEIACAIERLIDHPRDAEKMGRNGQAAVVERYNWGAEETKLLSLYQNILGNAYDIGRGRPLQPPTP